MIDSRKKKCGARGNRHRTRLLTVALSLCISAATAEEQREQDAIIIKGNQGLPRTLYIAPWKRLDEPLTDTPLENEFEQDTQPLERDLFQRELELRRQGYSVEQPSMPTTGSGQHDAVGTTR